PGARARRHGALGGVAARLVAPGAHPAAPSATYPRPRLTRPDARPYTPPMRLGLNVGYSGSRMRLNMDLIGEADRLGFHSVWTAEAYGSDAVTPLAYIAARTERIHLATGIMQMPARTPAMTAMTAMTLDQLSVGRFICGLGASGPQVVEGWHGVAYGKPLARMREYIEILRKIWARERPVEHQGEHYQIPYRGPGASGLGKPLKSILHSRQIPIYVAAIGPKS